jgi:hypothetical protein
MQSSQEPQLTTEELTRLQQFAKQGIHLTPEMLKNITSEFTVNSAVNALADRFYEALHITVQKEGKLFSLIQVTNPMFENVGMKEENPDFMKLWEQKNMKLSANMVKGFLAFATHGLNPYVKQELKPYDIDDLACIFLAKHFSQSDNSWRWKKGRIPKRPQFSKKMRKRIQKLYDEFNTVKRHRRNEAKMRTHCVRIYG